MLASPFIPSIWGFALKRSEIGLVVKRIGTSTVRVEVARQYSHSVYGKIVRSRTVCYAHDPDGAVAVGCLVEIVEGRPMSRLKRWWVGRVIGVGSRR